MAKKLETKSRLSYRTLALFVVIFAAVGGYILWKSFAAPVPPTVYLTPASQTFGPNSTFTVQIRENSGTTPVNAVQAILNYPANLLGATVVSGSTAGSPFSNVGASQAANGTINVAAGVGCNGTCTALTGDQLVATITFTTNTTAGSSSVAFASGTALVTTTQTNLITALSMTGGGTFITDSTPPTVSVTAPANGSSVSAPGTTTITVTATDSASSVSKVELYIDGALKTTLTSSPYSYAWSTSGVTLGSHTISAKAYDAFNNVATSATNTVTLADQTAPTTSITAPTGGTTVKGTVTVNANAADNTGGTGISKVELYVDGTLNATDTASPYSFSWNSTTATNASHSLTVKAYDGASPVNTATSSAVSVTVDNSAPTTPGGLTSSNITSNSLSLSWTASTDNIAVANYKLSRNGTLIATLPAGTLTYNDSGLSPLTAYSYSLVATDGAGNSSAAATLSATTKTAKIGDLDGNGAVDITDLSIMLSDFGSTDPVKIAQADIIVNGAVDIFDLSALLSHFGT